MRDYFLSASADADKPALLVRVAQRKSRKCSRHRTFMMRSGRNVPTPAIPMPDFAVPNAAPMPNICQIYAPSLCIGLRRGRLRRGWGFRTSKDHGKCNASLGSCLAFERRLSVNSLTYHSEERRKLGRKLCVCHDGQTLVLRKWRAWRWRAKL